MITLNPTQLHRIFDISLRNTHKKQGDNVFTLIVGANDGVNDDTLSGYTLGYGWKTLLVEPLPDHIIDLKATYDVHLKKGLARIAEVALSDVATQVEFTYIPNSVIVEQNLDPCIKGMSCINPPRNGFTTDPETAKLLAEYGKTISLQTITIDQLCAEYYLDQIDYVQCDTEGYDYRILTKFDFSKYRPKIFKVEVSNLTAEEYDNLFKLFRDNNYYAQRLEHQDMLAIDNIHLDMLRKNKRWEEVLLLAHKGSNVPNNEQNDIDTDEYIAADVPKKKNVTIVTGLWDIKRDECTGVFNRSFDTYLEKFKELLQVDSPMIIFTESRLIPFIEQYRNHENTRIFAKEVDELKTWFAFYDKVQQIRTNPDWRNIASWLGESTQANLEMYNPIVMSKMFLLNDAVVYNSFETEYYIWVDAAITNTVHPGYFTHDKVIDKIDQYLEKFLFVSFPYANYEIHGFPENKMRDYANCDKITYVCRGGIFGGKASVVRKVNEIYYSLLADTLDNGLMGTEESIFTIIAHKYPELVDRTSINEDGLLGTFFENLKNNTVNLIGVKSPKSPDNLKINLYVITFNSPKQFKVLCEKYSKESGFFDLTTKYCLDNSTDLTTLTEYQSICKEYGFEHIKKDNIGICGGRQFVAEHFDTTDADYYIFLEDDMNINNQNDAAHCKCGLPTYIPDLYKKVVHIIEANSYDFVKFSFTEFYGDNTVQWAWYNVPFEYRIQNFPERPYLPATGFDPYAPKTKFRHIQTYEGVSYADGEIYYCNWPQIVSRMGNKKMFLTDKWAHPFEQTWMSYIYQETKKGNIQGAVLLASPITHHRFDHYNGSERKES